MTPEQDEGLTGLFLVGGVGLVATMLSLFNRLRVATERIAALETAVFGQIMPQLGNLEAAVSTFSQRMAPYAVGMAGAAAHAAGVPTAPPML